MTVHLSDTIYSKGEGLNKGLTILLNAKFKKKNGDTVEDMETFVMTKC